MAACSGSETLVSAATPAAGGGGSGGQSGDGGASMGGEAGAPVAPPPQKQASFNEPHAGGDDGALEDVLGELVGSAVPGSIVRVGLYLWTRVPMTAPFVEAEARGVDVRIVLDKD